MAKKPIGFFNVNESKTKDNTDNSHNDSTECIMPDQSIISKIEEHINAKNEYEATMRKLYIYNKCFQHILVIGIVILCGVIFYAGMKYGEQKEQEKYQQELNKVMLVKQAYINGYNVGVKSLKAETK